ncbi:MAG: choice-of-anchor D domain-containing protein, partial [Streptosporangiaceae bacterium]
VSGDGRQVAFATMAAVAPRNGYPGTSTGGGDAGGGGRVSPDQVFVRSVDASVSDLVSSSPFKSNDHESKRTAIRGGNGASYAPVMTQDASTVAYVSQATDLTSAQVRGGAAGLYLRSASGGGANELAASAGPGTAIGLPSADAIGRLVTFPASGALTATAPRGIASVYTFDRLPSLSSSPSAAGFGSVLLDSGTRAIAVTVTDSGPGPGTVTGAAASGPFGVPADRCVGVTLQAGSRCTVTVTFTPSSAGPATGTLSVTTQDDDEPPVIGGVPATATVPQPLLVVSPGVASAGEACQVTGSSFPPYRKITLSWSPGLGSAVARSSSAGGFSAAMVIFPNDFIGPRSLIASGATGQLASAPFLVQQAPVEPPFTATPPP